MSSFLRIVQSRRVHLALAANVALSLAGLLLSIVVARSTSAGEFGQFSVAMLTFVFGSGAIRAALTESALASGREALSFHHQSISRVSLVSFVVAIMIIGAGLATSNEYMSILGFGFHGLSMFDSLRVFHSALGRGRLSSLSTASWATAMILISAATLVWSIDPIFIFVVWTVSGASLGYFMACVTRTPIRPAWARDAGGSRESLLFAADYAIGSGGSTLSTMLLGFVLHPSLVGGLRGAGTIVGPLTLISSTARSLSVAYLSNSRRYGKSSELKASVQITAVLAICTGALAGLIVLIPDELGLFLLGDTWSLSRLAIVPIALESILALVSSIPAAGLRAAGSGRTSIQLRLVVGLPRPIIIVWAALSMGIVGAAWAMAALAAVNCVLWWTAYFRTLRGPDGMKLPGQ